MNNHRRRNFRQRTQKNNFRRRSPSMVSNNSGNFNNGNMSFNRNGTMNNVHSVEKAMLKFHQLAKDAQSNGDPVLQQNYLQHADHYLRRFNELNEKKEGSNEKSKASNSNLTQNEIKENDKDLQQTNN